MSNPMVGKLIITIKDVPCTCEFDFGSADASPEKFGQQAAEMMDSAIKAAERKRRELKDA